MNCPKCKSEHIDKLTNDWVCHGCGGGFQEPINLLDRFEAKDKLDRLKQSHHRSMRNKDKTQPDYDCYFYSEGFCTCKAGPYNQAISDAKTILGLE